MIFSPNNTYVHILGVMVVCGLLIAGVSASGPPVPSFSPASPAPVASFTPSATSGKSLLTVEFTDTSTNMPTSWSWSYNNTSGNKSWVVFSTSRNPIKTFGVGNFTIRLNASNSYGYDISDQVTFINVSSSPGDSHGMTYFPPDHVWNYPVTNLPVHEYSDYWIGNIADNSIAHCTAGTFCYKVPANIWAYNKIPINWVNSSVAHTNVTTWRDQDGPWGNSDKIAAPFTPTLKVQDDSGQDDNILIIVDTDEKKVYEFFQAKKAADNSWSCNGEFVWDLNGYRIQPDPVAHPPYGLASASASGVPVIAGLIKYDEINAGHINHAAAGVVLKINYSVMWPGSHRVVGNSGNNDNSYPPYSARMRLKSSVDTSRMGTQAKIIAEALKTYGIILRDTGSAGVSITVEEDSRIDPWGSNMSGLHDLTLYDFEFVDESSLEINSSTAQVRTNSPLVLTPVSSFTGNVTSGTPPTAVQFNETSTGSPTWWAWFFECLNRLRLLILPSDS